MKKKSIVKKIDNEFNFNNNLSGSKLRNKVARNMYSFLPKDDNQLLELFDYLVSADDWKYFWLVTKWIKRKELYNLEYMKYYEDWLYNHIDSWGSCDVYCYRVLNPMLERYPELYKKVLEWAKSEKTYVRRAAPVSLLESTRSFKVNVSFSKVFEITEILKDDSEIHVQKGVGWLLKYAYLSYPEHVYEYLKNNVENLSRTIFRYALEKAPVADKEKLMNLDY